MFTFIWKAAALGMAVLWSGIPIHGETVIRKQAYHGWGEALLIDNGVVSGVIVPEIGRVMQFRFSGENDGPFWENRSMDGKKPDSQSSEWGNFGGDKSWPAPQAQWEKVTGRGWPPPSAFDSMEVEAKIDGKAVVLRSKMDSHYGIHCERRITLKDGAAEMIIETNYRKVEGPPVQVSIWIITQLKEPELMLMPLPAKSIYETGYNQQSQVLPLGLEVRDGAVLCRRSTKDSTKIGSDASRILWADQSHVVEVFSEREPGDYPDQNSSAEIYTNPDPNKYIELELLGPLSTLRPGSTISRRQTYRLYRRSSESAEVQMRKIAQSRN